jgi:hypothetical protein
MNRNRKAHKNYRREPRRPDVQVFTWHVEGKGSFALIGRDPSDTVSELTRLVGRPFRAHCSHGKGYGLQVS